MLYNSREYGLRQHYPFMHQVTGTCIHWRTQTTSSARKDTAVTEKRKMNRLRTYFEKPRPSIRTTIHVLARRMSGCSNKRTYSYLGMVSQSAGG